ncbi:LTA synthase family protein [Hymenobacter psychrotolerans]|uniref:Phosphoglycerol transferase MdoB n=1 Tax=Hymenobacter psychrotolerans DSM 18569 TaxID=1121959 RepID=A0A1M7F459_9BACT|nr:alkaline phosphatase family protein [Hymenobacter psychrotolerans]SHL98775.1 Phosphoglycerol transferase MdoB [Hymenobacter psychrotolerans DSM 18569]
MRNRFAFQPRYFLFWLAFFVVAKAVFLLYHFGKAGTLPAGTLAGIFGYGLRLDASAAAYLSLVPFVLLMAGSLLGNRAGTDRLIRFYTAVTGVLVAFLSTADLELYRTWGFRLDATPLQYLNSPAEMAASAGSAPLLLLIGAFIGLLLLGYLLYNTIVGRLPQLPAGFGRGRAALASLLYAVLLVVPLRGGVQQIPINQSDVYFASQPFANHAAVNVPWNVVNSLTTLRDTDPARYQFLPDSTAQRLVRPLYTYTDTPAADSATTGLLRTARPNVVFIILESFTAKLVGSMGGEAGITPNLDSLARTGVLFSNIYAAGDRSQKGLVALLSGYPSQPTSGGIIKSPRKTEQLPHLARSLKQAGYSTQYYYGGELAFANMKSYLMTAGYARLTERADFPKSQQNSKWGAHDHVLFDKVLADLRTQRQPFFTTAFTLSSHEPFEIPIPRKFRGTDETALFRNSVYYTDWALGRFLHEARQQPWYDNTLLVLVADHGHTLPGFSAVDSPDKFQIPLVLAGGALRPEARGRVVRSLGSQTDIAATLLAQLQLPATGYRWSRDLLRPVQQPSAFYCYNDGFGFVTPAGSLTFDNVSGRETSRTKGVPSRQLRQGQAYEQLSMQDYQNK